MQTFRTVLPVLLFVAFTELTGRVSCETWPCTRISVVRRIQFSKSPRPVPHPKGAVMASPDGLFGGCATRQERTPKQRPVSTQARSLTSEKVDVNPAGNLLAFQPAPYFPGRPCMLPAGPPLSSPEVRAYHNGNAVSMDI
jgi:hypothetical protein